MIALISSIIWALMKFHFDSGKNFFNFSSFTLAFFEKIIVLNSSIP